MTKLIQSKRYTQALAALAKLDTRAADAVSQFACSAGDPINHRAHDAEAFDDHMREAIDNLITAAYTLQAAFDLYPNSKPTSSFATREFTHVQCGEAGDPRLKEAGFATFNGGSHLCVQVPDGHATISCRTSEGQQITFAFVPYREGGPGKCVDVQRHTAARHQMNGSSKLPLQHAIAFGYQKKDIRIKPEDGYSLLTVILHEPEDNPHV